MKERKNIFGGSSHSWSWNSEATAVWHRLDTDNLTCSHHQFQLDCPGPHYPIHSSPEGTWMFSSMKSGSLFLISQNFLHLHGLRSTSNPVLGYSSHYILRFINFSIN